MAPMPATVCTTVAVSWNGTGLYDQPYDDVTPRVLADPGLSISLGKDSARTLDPPQVSACDFSLENQDGRYSQQRADSPLYQFVVPGRPVRLTIAHGTTDVYRGDDLYRENDPYRGVALYSLGSYAVDDISQSTAYGERHVEMACLGVEQVLTQASVTVGVMVGPRVDQAVHAVLDAVGWPSTARAVSLADTTLAYYWADDRNAWEALVELLRSEGPGAIYVQDGIFHFENRNYRTTTTRSQVSQATFFDTGQSLSRTPAYREDDAYRTEDLYRGLTSGLWFSDLTYDPGFRNIRNRATYTTRTRALAALAVVWSYGASLTLAAGQSVTLIARPTNPFQNAVTPALTTDYTVAGGTVSVSMSATSGLVAFITITQISGSPTVNGLQLRAQALTVIGETTVQNSVDASDSIAKFSPIPGAAIPRVFDVQGWPEINTAFAQAVCDAWVTRYQIQRPAVQITVENGDADLVRQILDRTMSDRISLVERNSGLSSDVWINAKHVDVSRGGGRRLTAVFGCETCEDVIGFLWDDPRALWGADPSDIGGARWGV